MCVCVCVCVCVSIYIYTYICHLSKHPLICELFQIQVLMMVNKLKR